MCSARSWASWDEDALGKAHATGHRDAHHHSVHLHQSGLRDPRDGGRHGGAPAGLRGHRHGGLLRRLHPRGQDLRLQLADVHAIGSSCLFGFPGTVIISNEVSESTGTTAEEKAAINAQIMPKMLVAGMVTVSITSVLVAGVMSSWL